MDAHTPGAAQGLLRPRALPVGQCAHGAGPVSLRLVPGGGVAGSEIEPRRLAFGDRDVLVGDAEMVRVFELLERLAGSDLPVLILGETGAGKENAAYAVHHHSRRRLRPFVPLNCAALPETLVESELFGHDRGAFSGAVTARAGLLESVAGGTLFLDEVGELALPVQAKLLRALDTQRITRVGERKERTVDVRVVAATNRVLEDEVAAGRFRSDLYFRLAAARVLLPPLRERRCEIPILFREFLARAAVKAGRNAPELAPATMVALLDHAWPGNVRELMHVAEFLIATVATRCIEPSDLPFLPARERSVQPAPALAPSAITPPACGPVRSLAGEIQELERQRMAEALAATGGVKTRAAKLLGMPLRTFTWKLRLTRERARRVPASVHQVG